MGQVRQAIGRPCLSLPDTGAWPGRGLPLVPAGLLSGMLMTSPMPGVIGSRIDRPESPYMSGPGSSHSCTTAPRGSSDGSPITSLSVDTLGAQAGRERMSLSNATQLVA